MPDFVLPSDLDAAKPSGGSGDFVLPSDADAASSERSLGERAVQPFIGFNKGVKGILAAPGDLAGWAMSKATGDESYRGAGSRVVGDVMMGADPDKGDWKKPKDVGDKILQGAGEGVAGAMLPEAAAAGLVRSGVGAVAPRVAEGLETMFGSASGVGASAANAGIGAAGGATGEVAAEVVPDDAPEWQKQAARLAGNLVGGGGAAVGGHLAGAGFGAAKRAVGDFVEPIVNPERYAGRALADAADGGKRGMLDALDNAPGELVPGSRPTTFQQTGDLGVGALEKLTAAQPEYGARFDARAAEQNAARVDTIKGLETGGDPVAIADAVRAGQRAVDDAAEKMMQQAQAAAEAAAAKIGGRSDPETMGAALRGHLVKAQELAKQAEGRLWRAVDPDNKLTMSMQPFAEAVQRVYGSLSKAEAQAVTPAERSIMGLLGDYEATEPLREFTGLRSRVSGEMAQARMAGEMQAYGRLVQLRKAADAAIDSTIKARVAAEGQAVAAGAMKADDTLAARLHQEAQAINAKNGESGGARAASAGDGGGEPAGGLFGDSAPQRAPAGGSGDGPGAAGVSPGGGGQGLAEHKVTDASGRSVTVRPKLVEADDVLASSDKGYDSSLQPRDRDRAASQQQVRQMSSRLDPERLGYSAESDRGAPIVGPDGMVESGNGRTMAIREAYAKGFGEDYRAWLQAQGYDTTGMKNPMLVRERISELTPEERRAFTVGSNQSSTLALSASEKALADARLISPDMLDMVANPSDLASGANSNFVRAFLKTLPETEHGAIVGKDRTLTAEGLTRVRNAILAKAYGDANVLARIAESTHDDIRSVSNGLVGASGEWAKMRAAVESGATPKDMDMTRDLVEAVGRASDMASDGMKLRAYLAQIDAFNQIREPVEGFLRMFYHGDGNRAASAANITERLKFLAIEARKVEAETGLDLGLPKVKPDELQRVAGEKGSDRGIPNETSAGVREGGAEGGEKAGGPRAGEGGGGSGKAGAGGAPPRILAPEPGTFDAAARERLKAATTATRERHRTFDNGVVGDVVKTRGQADDFRALDSAVPGKVWKAGDTGFENAKRFLDAAGTQEAKRGLVDAASASLRKAAMSDDGVLNPAKFAAWRKAHASALRAIPAADRDVFATAAKAGEALRAADVAARDAAKDYATGALKTVMGLEDPADVIKAVGGIFGKTDAVQQMRRVAGELKAPEARDGLRQAVVEHMKAKMLGTVEAGASGVGKLKPDMVQRFVRDNRPTLKAAGFSDAEIGSMQAVAADLQRAGRSQNAVFKTVGGSHTATLMKHAPQHPGSILAEVLGSFAVASHHSIGAGVAAGAGAGLRRWGMAMQHAGIEKAADLVANALLNPEAARILLQKAPDAVTEHAAITLGQRLNRVLLTSGVQVATH